DCVRVLLHCGGDRIALRTECRMHVIPAIESRLEHKGRLDSFDSTIAIRCAVCYVGYCSKIVAKRQPEEHISSREPKRSNESGNVRIDAKSLLRRFALRSDAEHVWRAVFFGNLN